MLFTDSYFTIVNSSEGGLKERGSKFLSYAIPVNSEQQIKEHLLRLKKLHPSASHHCYAWQLGPAKQAYRANDDGEPANSAGKPILSQIQARDLTDIMVVVVRYFGGTLLGVGGLINAYRLAAREALDNAVVVERFILFQYSVAFNFNDTNAVMRVLKELEAKIISNQFEEINTIIFQIKKQNSEKMENKFRELYNCKLEFIKLC
jgi:uncharacterized YigZ family protein